jgi:hypothetical protein
MYAEIDFLVLLATAGLAVIAGLDRLARARISAARRP